MRHTDLILGCSLLLAACNGHRDGSSANTAVTRSFDQLAKAFTGCALEFHACKKAGDKTDCRDEYLSCRDSETDAAEAELLDSVSACQQRAETCHVEADPDGGVDDCAAALRACIGDARAQSGSPQGEFVGQPNPKAPTYQCFGQLRACVEGSDLASQCLAQTRACVSAAFGEPPAPKPMMMRPDAGEPEAGASAAPEAGRAGGAAGGSAGSAPVAGTGGSGGSAPVAGAGGSAGRAPEAGASGSVAMSAGCGRAYDACLEGGEKPMKCERALRDCMQKSP